MSTLIYVLIIIVGSIFVYALMMGLTKAIALKAFDTKRWDNEDLLVFQWLWFLSLPVWAIRAVCWIGFHSPQLFMKAIDWFFQTVDAQVEREQKRIEQRRLAQMSTSERAALPEVVPVRIKKKRKKKEPELKSGQELGIYKEEKPDDNSLHSN